MKPEPPGSKLLDSWVGVYHVWGLTGEENLGHDESNRKV